MSVDWGLPPLPERAMADVLHEIGILRADLEAEQINHAYAADIARCRGEENERLRADLEAEQALADRARPFVWGYEEDHRDSADAHDWLAQHAARRQS